MSLPSAMRLEVVSPAPSEEEAAAIAAALARFAADHAPAAPPAPEQPPGSAWLWAARLEAVDRAPLADAWSLAHFPQSP